MNLKITIVEDEESAKQKLTSQLERYAKETNNSFKIYSYSLPLKFLEEYKGCMDILFFDIEMPQMDGMKLAEKLREKDSDTTLIFVTNLSQFAIKGYDYQAYSFLVKPVEYELLKKKLDLLMPILERKKNDKKILIHSKNGDALLALNDIMYIEISNHTMTYHLENKTYETNESMKAVVSKLGKENFSLVNQSFLLNLKYVSLVNKDSVFIKAKEFFFSRLRKKEFMEDFVKYVSSEL